MDGRRLKYGTMLVALVAAGLGLTASTQTWFTLALDDGGSGAPVTVQGSVAAPALAALSLAGLAFAGALAIAGAVIRGILAVLGVLVGASVVLSAITALTDPVQAASPAITRVSGIAGERAVARLVDHLDVGPWPLVAAIGGVLLAVAAVSVLVTGRRWPTSSNRYRPVTVDPADRAALLDLDDPRDGATGGDGGAEGGSTARGGSDDPRAADAATDHAGASASVVAPEAARTRPPAENARDQAIDDWDDLTRGEDPSDAPGIADPDEPDGDESDRGAPDADVPDTDVPDPDAPDPRRA